MTGTGVMVDDLYAAADSVSGTPWEYQLKTAAAVSDGNWSSAALNAVGAGASAVMARHDPVGMASSAAVAWAVTHLDPMKTWADELTGVPDDVADKATSLAVLAADLDEVAADLRSDAARAVDGQRGLTVSGYRRALLEDAGELARAAEAARAVSNALEQASVLVEAVRSFLLGMISEMVAQVIKRGVLALTGAGAVVVAGTLAVEAGSMVARARVAMELMTDCLRVLRSQLRHLVEEVRGIAAHVVRRQVRPAPRHRGTPQETVAGRLAGLAVGPAVSTTVNTADRDARNRHEST